MDYIKAKTFDGTYPDKYTLQYKIDGVRVLYVDGKLISRAGKEFPGLRDVSDEVHAKLAQHPDCEFYVDDWSTSNSISRSHDHGVVITPDMFYTLNAPDPRLQIDKRYDDVQDALHDALQLGYEGVMIKSTDGKTWYRVKPVRTADLYVRGIKGGTGKHKGVMGALITDLGKVGTGFSDEERRLTWNKGTLIEVEYTELTKDGMMRHPRFKRIRTDKTEQSY